jgi:hypothetical protein
MLRLCVGASVCFTLAVLVGCGSSPPPIVPVECVVKLNGTPLPKAKVIFYPQFENSSEYIAQGMTDDNGRVTPTCKGQPGACATENIVAVVEDIPERLTPEGARAELQAYMKSLPNRPIPSHYRNMSESALKVAFSPDKKEYTIELKR